MSPSDLSALAGRVKQAQDAAQLIDPITGQMQGFDVSAAYTVAREIHRARLAEGATPVGRKIGFTNPDMWVRYGVGEPIWGWMYDRTLVRAVDGRARLSLARFAQPKIEPEIVFGFAAAPAPGVDAAAVLACIEWVALGFEIVQSNFPDWKFEAPDTIADSGLHGTLVVGEPQPLHRFGASLAAALESFTLELACDGQRIDSGKGSNVLGSPLAAVAHLCGVLARQAESPPLQAGEIVTTGTVTAAHPVQAGQHWQGTVEGIALPGLAIEFTA